MDLRRRHVPLPGHGDDGWLWRSKDQYAGGEALGVLPHARFSRHDWSHQ